MAPVHDHDDDAAFLGFHKAAVLQEARIFNDSQLDTRSCGQVITLLLYLINQGETFTKKEATEVFFAVTKLFRSQDMALRRLVYLMIKEISPASDEVIMAVSSLMKDMSGNIPLGRANAIRVLCRITAGPLLGQMERLFKQSVVDKSPVVSSAAIVSGIHLLKDNAEIVRRWSSEVHEALYSTSPFVQFHALALLHQIKQRDRLEVSKLVRSLTRGTVRSTLAQCLLVRYTSQLINECSGNAPGGDRPYFDYLESCLRNESEMVAYEAARTVTDMSNVTSRELSPAINVLQMLLTSRKPLHRFAAARTLNKVAMTHPLAVANCNIAMESLISDQNRGIATLAFTTLLKTGNESTVDRLVEQITNFMLDIADEFKIMAVQAIRSLGLKFPQKHRSLMSFLSGVREGGFEYKKAVVDSILIFINEIPDAKESGLCHLCEFIEDPEFTYLSTQILHLLGVEGPKTVEPGRYIRYIYNRVILENARVRACAVSSLARFGLSVESLRPRIAILLRRCLYDDDGDVLMLCNGTLGLTRALLQVRDRATLYLTAVNGDSASREEFKHALLDPLDVPLVNLEASLQSYVPSESPFDIYAVSREIKTQALGETRRGAQTRAVKTAPVTAAVSHESRLNAIPGFSAYGKLLKSCEPVELTEAGTEYDVNVLKHMYPQHIVFEFNCKNTVAELYLEKVDVVMEAESADFQNVLSRPIPSLPCGVPAQAYVAFKKPEGLCIGKFSSQLKFVAKEIDPATEEPEEGGYEDYYMIEAFEVVVADYFLKNERVNFRSSWESLSCEQEGEYDLDVYETVQGAVEKLIVTLGLPAVEGTEKVQVNARSHTCLLSGKFINGTPVLVRLAFGMDARKHVMMKMVVRSDHEELCQMIHDYISDYIFH